MLVALALALIVAFVVAPGRLATGTSGVGFVDEPHLQEAFRGAFVRYWNSGGRDLPPDLDGIVDYWLRYHLAKAGIAAVALVVLALLGVRLWRAFLSTDGRGTGGGGTDGGGTDGGGAGRRAGLASAAAFVTMLALLATVTVMANVQGMLAPFASLFPMLTGGTAGGELTASLDGARQQLAGGRAAGASPSPALDVMLDEFARYHVVMAVIAAAVAVVLAGLCLTFRKQARAASADARARRLLRSFAVLSALLMLATVVLSVANATTAADSTPALLALLEGGW